MVAAKAIALCTKRARATMHAGRMHNLDLSPDGTHLDAITATFRTLVMILTLCVQQHASFLSLAALASSSRIFVAASSSLCVLSPDGRFFRFSSRAGTWSDI